jgi:hypothetical protein
VNNTQDIIQIQNINKGSARKEKEDFHKNAHNNIFEEEVDKIEKKLQTDLQ